MEELATLAETYACNEAQDWFATEVVKNDFKRARGISESFKKLSKDCYGKVQQLNALYEDMGHILERYYEIADQSPAVSPQTNTQPPVAGPAPTTPTPELSEDTKNPGELKSQREDPQGGPTAFTFPKVEDDSVPVDPAGAGSENLKGQRDVPQNGPSSYKFPKTYAKLKDILNQKK
jgi:hypothetical protein